MPFKSKSQMRTCYGQNSEDWDCDLWLSETRSFCSLPENQGERGERYKKVARRVKTGPHKGSRGGIYFRITEFDTKQKIICSKKFYVQ